MDFSDTKIKHSGKRITPKEYAQREILFDRCPGMEFYLKEILRAYREPTQAAADRITSEWAATAPRPEQRRQFLNYQDEGEYSGVIAFGAISGTGKTSAAFEDLWFGVALQGGGIDEPDREMPMALSGHAFARRISEGSLKLDSIMRELQGAHTLLLDDLDKRGGKDGKYSPAVQQALLDLIESRSTHSYRQTIITLNSSGDQLAAKFDDDVGPYLLRRLRERFRCIDFDPMLYAANVVPMEAMQ